MGGVVGAALVLAAGRPVAAQTRPDEAAQQKQQAQQKLDAQQKIEAAQKAQTIQQQQQLGRVKALPSENAGTAQEASGGKALPPGQAMPGKAPAGSQGAPGTGAQPGGSPGASGLRQPGTGATPTGGGSAGHTTRPPKSGEADEGPQPGPDEVSFSAFSEGIDLKALVEYVADALHIMIIGNDALTGSVVFNGPMIVKKSNLLPLLNSLLENQNYTITSDPAGFYKVIQISSTIWNTSGDLATTRIIPTPTIKPSALADAINNQLGIAGAQTRISYMDDLGVIVITDSTRRIEALSELIQKVLDRSEGQQFIRFDLKHVAAPVARQRVLDVLGVGQTTTGGLTQPVIAQVPPGQAAPMLTGVVTNLSDRLSIDAAGNALIFRGYPEESQRIEEALGVIDRPNTLHYKQYYAGKAAAQIADLADRLGLGHVETVDSSPQPTTPTTGFNQQPQNRFNIQQANAALQQQQQQQQQGASLSGGPVMIVDVARNLIIYYGTDAQQRQLEDLIGKFDTEQDEIVISNYKIKNQDAQDVADVLSGIVYGQNGPDTSNPFLPGGGFGFNQFRNGFGNQFGNNTQNNRSSTNTTRGSTTNSTNRSGTTTNRNQPGSNVRPFGGAGFGGGNRGNTAGQTGPGAFNPDEVFIMADSANNQVIIKAPKGEQQDFAALIDKLDQRRPQVQIDVQIVSVTATDDFRLAFETQILAGQFGLNTNFGVGSLTTTTPGTGTAAGTTTGGFTSRKVVNPSLPGITAALIKSSYVPIVMTALKDNSDTRILSCPQITVDDNVQATIESTDQQPTSSTSQTNSSTINSFNGYESAGTTVTVTPSISEGGYMRLNYDIDLSNFVGTGANGFPAPKQDRHVTSEAVTIPADTTIVVGGIKVDAKSSTVSKIPILGDIPILGNLFKDQSKQNSTTRLYVFITPRILRDPHFQDMRLLTQGPLAEAGLAADIPPLEPVMMDMVEPKRLGLPTHRPAEPAPGEAGGTPAAMAPSQSPLQEGTAN